jgi:hypothetical protein
MTWRTLYFVVHFATLSIAWLNCVEYQDDGWIMNWKGSGRNQSWLSLRHCPGICLEGTFFLDKFNWTLPIYEYKESISLKLFYYLHTYFTRIEFFIYLLSGSIWLCYLENSNILCLAPSYGFLMQCGVYPVHGKPKDIMYCGNINY